MTYTEQVALYGDPTCQCNNCSGNAPIGTLDPEGYMDVALTNAQTGRAAERRLVTFANDPAYVGLDGGLVG